MKRHTNQTRDNSVQTYRRVLLNKKAELLVALGINCQRLANSERESGEDQVKVSHDEFVRLRLSGVFYGQLRQVEYALDRLALGKYGICAGCGSPIPWKRLRALPWARYCIACQEKTGSLSAYEAFSLN